GRGAGRALHRALALLQEPLLPARRLSPLRPRRHWLQLPHAQRAGCDWPRSAGARRSLSRVPAFERRSLQRAAHRAARHHHPPELPWTTNSYWMYSILIGDDFGVSRDQVMVGLKAAGIETRSFFVSMHRQPALAKFGCDVSGDYPVTDDLARRGLYLPSSSGLTDAQIARISSALLALRR